MAPHPLPCSAPVFSSLVLCVPSSRAFLSTCATPIASSRGCSAIASSGLHTRTFVGAWRHFKHPLNFPGYSAYVSTCWWHCLLTAHCTATRLRVSLGTLVQGLCEVPDARASAPTLRQVLGRALLPLPGGALDTITKTLLPSHPTTLTRDFSFRTHPVLWSP